MSGWPRGRTRCDRERRAGIRAEAAARGVSVAVVLGLERLLHLDRRHVGPVDADEFVTWPMAIEESDLGEHR